MHTTQIPKKVIHAFDHIEYPLPPSSLILKMERQFLAHHLIQNKNVRVNQTQKDLNKTHIQSINHDDVVIYWISLALYNVFSISTYISYWAAVVETPRTQWFYTI